MRSIWAAPRWPSLESEYPRLDTTAYLARIDELAIAVTKHLTGDESGSHRSIAALNYVLFQKCAFRGNRDEYFDAKNSFLNEVIDRRTGIPITLSVLYMEVAQRIGLPLLGVGFPGHFFVKYLDDRKRSSLIHLTAAISKLSDSLRQLLAGLYGKPVAWSPQLA